MLVGLRLVSVCSQIRRVSRIAYVRQCNNMAAQLICIQSVHCWRRRWNLMNLISIFFFISRIITVLAFGHPPS